MRSAAYRLASLIEKRAASASGLLDLARRRSGASVGALAGGLYGGYLGATGPEADAASTLGGVVSGAVGGGMLGHAAQGVVRAVHGGPNKGIFGQLADARAAANEHVRQELGHSARTGFLADARNADVYRQGKKYTDVLADMGTLDSHAHAGLVSPVAGRQEMDALTRSDPLHNYERLKKKLLWGGVGTGLTGMMAAPLVMGAGDAASDHREQIVQHLLDRHKSRGRLDERELALLVAKTRGE